MIFSLYQFSKLNIDWTKEQARCKAIMWGAFQNLGSALDTWAELEEFDDLLQKTARMFVCVPPKKLRELSLVHLILQQGLMLRPIDHFFSSRFSLFFANRPDWLRERDYFSFPFSSTCSNWFKCPLKFVNLIRILFSDFSKLSVNFRLSIRNWCLDCVSRTWKSCIVKRNASAANGTLRLLTLGWCWNFELSLQTITRSQ